MEDIYIYEINSNNLSNIDTLSEKRFILEERRICELREIVCDVSRRVLSLTALGMSTYEILSLIADRLFLPHPQLHAEVLDDFAPYLKRECELLSSFDRAVLCSLLCDELSASGLKITESDFLSISDGAAKFVYVKNSFSDEAYDVFSQEFENPRVIYVKSFKEAIAYVTSDRVTYCLLPIEERGSRISTVAQLIYSADLKIASVTPVLGMDGLADVKYAMISKAFLIPDIQPDDDRYLEINIPSDAKTSLSELLSVADYYGISIHRLNTFVSDTEDGQKTCYSVVFRSDGRDFVAMLTYLTLYTEEFTPIGIYKNLE